MALLSVSSPFQFRLDRRKSAALVEAWIVISRKRPSDGLYVRAAGPFTLKRFNAKIEHSGAIDLSPGEYRVKVELTVTEADRLSGIYDFRLSLKDDHQDQLLYDKEGNVDTSDGIDVVVGTDLFSIKVR